MIANIFHSLDGYTGGILFSILVILLYWSRKLKIIANTFHALHGIVAGAAVLLLLALVFLVVVLYPSELVDLSIAGFGLILVIAGIQHLRRSYWEHISR